VSKAIDLRIDDVVANAAGKSMQAKTLQGLSILKGPTLKLFVPEGGPLPKVFPAQGNQGVFTVKRLKAEEGCAPEVLWTGTRNGGVLANSATASR